jgi:hypothetical protein
MLRPTFAHRCRDGTYAILIHCECGTQVVVPLEYSSAETVREWWRARCRETGRSDTTVTIIE